MSAYEQFEDDDLAMYAMGLLAAPEATAVARAASEDEGMRRRLAAVQAQLGAFAEVSVTLEEAPAGSLHRLMEQIQKERRTVPFPSQSRAEAASVDAADADAEAPRRTGRGVLPWVGWAVAAGMAVAAGSFYREQAAMHANLQSQAGQVAQVSAETAEATRQRDALSASVAEQTKRVEALRAEKADVEKELSEARGTTAAVRSSSAAAAAGLAEQTSRVNQLTAQIADAERQRAALQATVSSQAATLNSQTAQLAAQADQVARLRSETTRAREVLDTLTDRTALRVTLTEPKSKPEPTGRTTYVASRGTLVFQGSNLAALPPNKVYELWLLPADGSAPVPAGTFSPDARGNANLVSPKLAGELQAKAFAITVENEGGATTPTMPIVLVGAAG